MSEEINNTSGENLSPDVEKLQLENEQLLERINSLTGEIEALKVELDNEKNKVQQKDKDTTGIPVVVMLKGVKYTREEILADKSLLAELKKMNIFKSKKEK